MTKEKFKKIPDSFYYDGRKKKWRIENIKGEVNLPNKNNMKFKD